MTKRIIFTLVWALGFLVVSAIALFLAWRVYFAMTGAPAQRPSEGTFFWFGLSISIIPLVLGAVAAQSISRAFSRDNSSGITQGRPKVDSP